MSSIRYKYGAAQKVKWDWQASWRENAICIWCNSKCNRQPKDEKDLDDYDTLYRYVWLCPKCGWWTAHLNYREEYDNYPGSNFRSYFIGVLREFDIASDEVPLQLLIKHISQNSSDLNFITPRRMEALVQSVFREFYDCDVEYYSGDTYASDGGIDLIAIHAEEGLRTAIQVKRRARDIAESVKCVREFVGAMVVEGFRKGLYVTTGHFSKPAQKIPTRLAQLTCGRQLTLELLEGAHLHELLAERSDCPFDEEFWDQAIKLNGNNEAPFFQARTKGRS